jgi:hypothetical protein
MFLLMFILKFYLNFLILSNLTNLFIRCLFNLAANISDYTQPVTG